MKIAKILLCGVVIGLPSLAQACDVTVSDAWLRLPPPVSDTAAAYMKLSNHCQQSKTLKSISSPQASMTMMHNANMQMMPSVVLKAGGVFEFQPGMAHVMLMRLKTVIHIDDDVLLILHWQDGSSQTLHIPVKDMRGMGM